MNLKNLVFVLPEKYLEEIIEKKPELVNWENLSIYKKLSEQFIEKYANKVDWKNISRYQKLSESFIEKYDDDVNWYNIMAYQKHLSDEFKEKHMWKVSPLLRKYLTENNSLEELN